MFEIHYYGAAWCAPCKTQKPIVVELAKRYGVALQVFDIDDECLEPAVRESIHKLPTVRIFREGDGQVVEFVTKQAEQLSNWLAANVRVKATEDF